MDITTFDRLTRLFGLAGTRRAALSALLGSAVPSSALTAEATKRLPNGKSKPRGKAKRGGKRRKKSHGRARAQAKKENGNHCIAPNGDDLNELFGVSAQILTRFCTEVGSGEQWTTGQPWFMAQTFEAVPEGFTPAGDTPLEDFIAKFIEVKYVIDPGTQHEKTVIFPNGDKLFVDPDFNGGVLVSPITLGLLKPEPVGPHVFDLYWSFSALHCDGLAANVDENCLPAGEFRLGPTRAFEVTAGHN
jgi:hypothetical protein